MGFRQVLAVGSLSFIEIGHRVQPQPIYPLIQPKVHHLEQGFFDVGIIKIEIGLMGIKTVPIVGFGNGIPRPVRGLKILKDNPGFLIFFRGVAPDIKIPLGTAGWSLSRPLKPGMLVRGVVEHELDDHPQPPLVGLIQKSLEVF